MDTTRLCKYDFSFLPMPLVSSVKYQSKLPKSLLVGVHCFNRNVMFHRKSVDLNDFSLKLMKCMYLMLFCQKPIFVQKSGIKRLQKTQALHLQHQSALRNLVVVKSLYWPVNHIIDKNPPRLYSNKTLNRLLKANIFWSS